MENLRVYLVDDHPLMRMALRRILESRPTIHRHRRVR